eukprot:GEMP01034962.1.p1 GENE.GEMP01034962.1~~GEMP01034962.1.p1  ORF type:complete len:473 (+),score=112.77 GEMP01034962.1:240-1658(+)
MLRILALAFIGSTDDFGYVKQGADWVSAYPQCKKGNQSPVALEQSQAVVKALKSVIVLYPSLGGVGRLYNTGRGLAVTLPDAYRAGFALGENQQLTDARIFRLKQIRFHAPAEHKLNHNVYPLELQMTHYEINTHQLATVSILFDGNGESNAFLDHFSAHVPRKASETVAINTEASGIYGNLRNNNLGNDLIFSSVMKNASFFAYEGSITEPPCEPSVVLVRNGPVIASTDQVQALVNAIVGGCSSCTANGGNARIVQELTSELELLPSMDWNDRDRKPPMIIRETDAEVKPVVVGAQGLACPDNIAVSDTKELMKAKEKCNNDCSSASNARNWKSQATLNLHKAQALYDASSGVMAKIDNLWGVLAAKADLRSAQASLESQEPSCKASLEAVAQLMAPTDAAAKRKKVEEVKFVPKGNLPRGSDADPFHDTTAESEPRVFTGGTTVPDKLVSDLSRAEPNAFTSTSFLSPR